jgi:hypothetical protein
MNSTGMMERFQQFATADLFSSNVTGRRQVSQVLHETDPVRIVLTRYEAEENLDIDVEVSLPSLKETSNAEEIRESIDKVMNTLEYLRHLIDIGFNLELMREEGIFIASKELNLDTPEHVFEVLQFP